MNATYVIDIDGTLCTIKGDDEEYKDVQPMLAVVDKVNKMYYNGDTVILFTARGMRTYDGDVEEIEKHVRPTLEKWLALHKVRYHQLIMGKPWGPNVKYVDDNNLTIKEFLKV